jgi:DnaK suppressor protein
MNKKNNSSPRPSLTPSQLQEYKELLYAERNRVLKRLKASSMHFEADRQAGDEGADIGSDDFIRDTGISIMADNSQKLNLIVQALRQIEQGTYGICQDCGQLIGEGRLKAKPHARYCINCKTIREKNGGSRPDEA